MANIFICLRYDDWGLHSEALEYDKKLIDISLRYNIPITVSIVPLSENLKNKRNDLISKDFSAAVNKGLVEVAMHGYRHKRSLIDKILHVYGEFGKKPAYIQKKQLSKGYEKLRNYLGKETTIFVPPYNVYDNNTVCNLKRLGFDLLSDGPSANLMFSNNAVGGVKRVPFTCGIENVYSVVDEIKQINDENTCFIVALFHHYNFSIHDIEELIGKLSMENGVRFATLRDISDKLTDDMIIKMETQKARYYCKWMDI